jgi:uncharacterized protein YndB with AHSA1/START domain
MVDLNAAGSSTEVSRIIRAPRSRVYRAFLDPESVAAWLAPDQMQGHVHIFEPHEGGRFRISLQYQNLEDSQPGKTDADTDTYHGQFIKLVPDEMIVEVIEFESQEPDLQGEMTMTVRLANFSDGTNVSLLFENIPAGIRLEDHEAGSQQSLRKLAALVE